MEKIKLIFIGKDAKNFTYKGRTFRPYYVFGEKYTFDIIAPYLDSLDEEFNYAEFAAANTKAGNKPANVYACLSEPDGSFYAPVANDRISKFNLPAATTNVIKEQSEPKPISNEYIIATERPDIVKMMEKRGCTVLKEGKLNLIVEENNLKFAKKWRDELDFEPTMEKRVKTRTGYEETLKVKIVENKKTTMCKGVAVYSLRNNKYYGLFIYNNTPLFFERWFDEKGNLIEAEKNSKTQSNRVYEWKVD